MPIVRSFEPVSRPDARVLVLGSMPGKASLQAGQYYAHPHNLFWFLMGELFGAGPALDYGLRLEILKNQRVALWDVLQECQRETALDADIVESSIITNDFADFFAGHPNIERIYFNGSKAEQAFRKYVLPQLTLNQMQLLKLPSTSPANAGIPRSRKLEDWRQIRQHLER